MDSGTERGRELPTQELSSRTEVSEMLANAERQARERRFSDYFIVDIDAHHIESRSWKEVIRYLDDPVMRQVAESFNAGSRSTAGLLNVVPGLRYQHNGGRCIPAVGLDEEIAETSVHRDVYLARKAMDAMGVDIQIVFPTPMLTLGLHPQTDVEVAVAFAYNRWLTEVVLSQEPRIKSMLYLPFNEPEACVRMVEEFAETEGVVGFMVTGPRYRAVHHNNYMRLYAMLEERGLTLGFHAAHNWNDDYTKQLNRFITMHAVSFVLCSMVHLSNWIINGLPERFPKLKVMWIESGIAWVPFMMQRLDNEYLMRSAEAPLLKRLPSEYMREMYYTTQPLETSDMGLLESGFEAMNAKTQLLFSSDWPHWDFDIPSRLFDLPFLDEEARRNILGENARRLLNL